MSRSAAAQELDDTATTLYEQAMTLPQSERRALANRLLDSLDDSADDSPSDPEVEQAWAEEAARRLDDIRAGRSKPVPWAEARARIFARG